jgi:transposase
MVGSVYPQFFGAAMKALSAFQAIHIYRQPVDMRKSIDGLSPIVSEEMGLDLQSSSLFIFCNRRRTHIKMLYIDKSGFALWLKKLDASKFAWPKNLDQDVIEISREDLELMLDGVNIWTRFKKICFDHVV